MTISSLVVAVVLVTLCLTTVVSGSRQMRGPHHPRGARAADPSNSHHHYVPPKPGASGDSPATPILHDQQLLHDTEHLKEDLGDWVFADGKELSPEEMEFHYFTMHDFDNNSKLDGLEILQAIMHILPIDEGEEINLTNDPTAKNKPQGHDPYKMTDEMKQAELKKRREENLNDYIAMIDEVLAQDDLDKDGYINYYEYTTGRRRAERKEASPIKLTKAFSY